MSGQKRHTIGIRGIVALSLAAMMACTAGLGVLSFVQLHVVDQTAASLRRTLLPAVEAAQQLARAAEQARGSQAMLLLDLPESDQKQARADIERQFHFVEADIAALGPLLITADDRSRLESITADWQRYVASSIQFIQLVDTLTLSEANQLLGVGMANTMTVLRVDLAGLIDTITAASDVQVLAGEIAGEQTRKMILFGALAAVLSVITTGFLLSRRLVQPILIMTGGAGRP